MMGLRVQRGWGPNYVRLEMDSGGLRGGKGEGLSGGRVKSAEGSNSKNHHSYHEFMSI